MAESTTSIPATPPSFDALAAQAALAASAPANEANNAAFLVAVTQMEVGISSAGQANTADETSSLLSLGTPDFSLLNEIGTQTASTTVSGNLTPQQLHDIGILQHDMLGLEDAANLSSSISLSSGVTMVDLSVEAQAIVNGSVVNGAMINEVITPSPVNASPPLTTAQLGQIGAILAPLANEPLTQPLLLQIQSQLAVVELSPLQLSLNTVLIAMNYMAGLQPAAMDVMKSGVTGKHEVTVDPASSIDAVVVENLAIL